MRVVSDTTPINYLVLIGAEELLPALFVEILLPAAVLHELQAPSTPETVRQWITSHPPWLKTTTMASPPDTTLSHLDEGEREAIQLAVESRADLLLVDEKAARREATSRGLATSGTLGILDRAAEKGLVDFAQALHRLKQTSFYLSSSVEEFFLKRDAQRRAR
jgi:predicted nucleic acid-binding protein